MSDLYIALDGDERDKVVWTEDPLLGGPKALLTEHQAGPVLWAHLVATLPSRDDPQPEPTDPAVRVVDDFGVTWARVGDKWATAEKFRPRSWRQLNLLCGPLTIIPPVSVAEPEARPFQVGDRVRVAEEATWNDGTVSDITARLRGRIGFITRPANGKGEYSVNLTATRTTDGVIAARFLTHADPA